MLPSERFLFIVSLLLVSAILIVIAFGRWLNYRVLFQPQRQMIWRPPLGTYKDIYVRTGDINGKPYSKSAKNPKYEYINMWYFDPFENEKVVLYCHGNNDNNSYRDYVIDICHRFHLNLLLVDYRGYGNSDGYPTSAGVAEDARCGYGYLRRNFEQPIFFHSINRSYFYESLALCNIETIGRRPDEDSIGREARVSEEKDKNEILIFTIIKFEFTPNPNFEIRGIDHFAGN